MRLLNSSVSQRVSTQGNLGLKIIILLKLKLLIWLTKIHLTFNRLEELDLLEEIIKKGCDFKSYLMQILHDAHSYAGEDLSVMCKPLLVVMKVMIRGSPVPYFTNVAVL